MYKIILLIIITILGNLISMGESKAQDSLYYYFRGEPTYLQIDTSKLLIKFDSCTAAEGYDFIKDSVSYLNYDSTLADRLESFGIFDVEPTKGYASAINELESFEMIEFINPLTMIYDSIPIYILDRFIVQFYSYESQSLIDSLIEAYYLEIIDSIPEAAGEYIFRITEQTGYSIDEISNIFYNMDCTAFSHPDFLCRATPCAYQIIDDFYAYQTNIKKNQ